MKANEILKVICTFWSIAEYEVVYANGKTKKFTEDTLPQNAKDFVIKRIGTEGHIEENVCMKIGYFVKKSNLHKSLNQTKPSGSGKSPAERL